MKKNLKEKMEKETFLKIKWVEYCYPIESDIIPSNIVNYDKKFMNNPKEVKHSLTIRRNSDKSYTLWVDGVARAVRKERWQILNILDMIFYVSSDIIKEVEKELYKEWYAL